MSSKKGDLYILPSPISDVPLTQVIPEGTIDAIRSIKHFIVEKPRPARRFLVKMDLEHPIDDLHFGELNKHTTPETIPELIHPLLEGYDMALLSDAGCPGIADPGAKITALSHQQGIRVVPLIGPSSILLALMASGLNGQDFHFRGYVPKQKKGLRPWFRQIEEAVTNGSTQIFMETPYRNEQLFKEVTEMVKPSRKLCIAVDITSPDQEIRTMTISEWKKEKPRLHKRPAIFLLGD